jgi:ribosomal protein S18 acetylase RimI-like enzyme
MADAWDWLPPIRERHLGRPLLDRLPVVPVQADEYWRVHEATFRAHYPPEAFLDLRRVLQPEARARAERVAASEAASGLAEHWLVRDGDRVVALFSGRAAGDGRYQVFHVNVHPDLRRQGVLTAILDRLLGYTAEAGFDQAISEHAPSNNAVLIAFLRRGFRITGLAIDAALGPTLHLAYFHHAEHLAAYELRNGMATLTPALRDAGFGAFEQLAAQFAAPPSASA